MLPCCFSALPQDELYLQHLADACQDAVRRFLGPRWALQHARQVSSMFYPGVLACLLSCLLACLSLLHDCYWLAAYLLAQS